MNISEIVARKNKLEKDLEALLLDFTNNTSVMVGSITVNYIEVTSKRSADKQRVFSGVKVSLSSFKEPVTA